MKIFNLSATFTHWVKRKGVAIWPQMRRFRYSIAFSRRLTPHSARFATPFGRGICASAGETIEVVSKPLGRDGVPPPSAIITQRNISLFGDCGGRGATRPACRGGFEITSHGKGLGKEAKRIFSAGGDALMAGKARPAKEAVAHAEALKVKVVAKEC